MTSAEKVILKAHIQATPALDAIYVDGNLVALADALNVTASPDYWVWRTDVTRSDIYNKPNGLPVSGAQTGFWDWTTYKNQGVAEQNAWVQMFMGDIANFSQLNLREGIGKIFTGSAAANAQRDHCLAIGRRLASLTEEVFATGTGSTASPATMSFEGQVTVADLIGL